MSMHHGYRSPEDILARTAHLVDAGTGLLAPPVEIQAESGGPEIIVYSANLPRVQDLHSHVALRSHDAVPLAGAGSSTDRDQARAKAVCEALERYCTAAYDARRVVVASRDELGDESLDLRLFARGSDAEYEWPGATLVPPRNDQAIRWVRGHSMTRGRPVWVPFSSVYVSSPCEYPGEAYAQPISTGSAIAGTYERAVVAGALEVMERDALSLTWLQRLPLPRIDTSGCIDPAFVDRARRVEAAGITQHFFNATTDLGFPTAYLVQTASGGELAALVMAATRLDMTDALVRVMDEASASRSALRMLARRPPSFDPANFTTFRNLTDGAVFYGDAAHAAAFDFLLRGPRSVPLHDIAGVQGADEGQMLDRVVERFRGCGLELAVVDLTVPEVAACGLHAVRVVAPQLMPLTIDFNMKFSATPRLSAAPAAMGYRVTNELNPWPQPFA